MKRESSGPILSAVFVDYDNIYLSLKRKSEEAAKRFAKDAGLWLQGDRDRRADHADQLADARRRAPHRHEPLLRQSRAAPQPERQFDRHELVPVRAPSLPARRVRGGRLPAADRPAQELVRHPHGHGCARLPHARHLLRRVHHPVGRRRLHAGAAPPARARPAHGDLRQRSSRRRPTPRSATARSAKPICIVAAARRPARRPEPGDARRAGGTAERRFDRATAQGNRRRGRRRACAPPTRRCRSRRSPIAPCARSATTRPSAPPGPAPAASASCCAQACPRTSA